jgi:ATP-dependent Clp protease adaptor protein ClpS
MSDTVVKKKTALKPPSMWTVVFLNDDFTPMEFVVHVLVTVFHKTVDEATQIMLLVHQQGKARVGSYTCEIATEKADRTMLLAVMSQHPLQVFPERI